MAFQGRSNPHRMVSTANLWKYCKDFVVVVNIRGGRSCLVLFHGYDRSTRRVLMFVVDEPGSSV